MGRLSTISSLAIVGVLGLTSVAFAAGSQEAAVDAAGDRFDAVSGCGEVTERPDTDRPYVRYEEMRSHPDFPAILGRGDEITRPAAKEAGFEALMPSDTKGLDEAHYIRRGTEFITHLTKEPLTSTDTAVDVLVDGGATIRETPRDLWTIVTRVKRVLKLPVPVEIGPYNGIISQGDEIAPGVRTFNVFWSDGETDWAVSSGMKDSRDVIELARSMVCE